MECHSLFHLNYHHIPHTLDFLSFLYFHQTSHPVHQLSVQNFYIFIPRFLINSPARPNIHRFFRILSMSYPLGVPLLKFMSKSNELLLLRYFKFFSQFFLLFTILTRTKNHLITPFDSYLQWCNP